MSYDLRIMVKIEGCGIYKTIATPEYDNPTYNLRKMFVACMDWNYKQGEIYKCSDIINNVNKGITELESNRKQYEIYNPANGWGDLDNAIVVLKSLRDCIYEHAEEIPIDCLYMSW